MKYKRHSSILDIISKKEINTQQALLDELTECGFKVTQATLSRDIKELALIKLPGKNGYRYCTPDNRQSGYEVQFTDGIVEGITGISCAMHTIIVKTMPGLAPVAGSIIDSMNNSDILGTVAGDDTVLVICTSPETAQSSLRKIDKIFKDKKR